MAARDFDTRSADDGGDFARGGRQMRKTFRVRSMLRVLGPLLATCAVTMVILLVVTEPDARIAVWATGGVLLVAIGIVAWLVTRTRLDIGPDGIVYHAIGYRVVGAWDDVVGTDRRVMGASEVECLVLRAPAMEMSGWLAAGYRLMPVASILAVFTGRTVETDRASDYADVIPVGVFDSDWRTGEIGAMVRQYAPQALDAPAP
jgi:hypothetical protein